MRKEKWKYVEAYNKDYLISNRGRVKSLKRKEAILKPLVVSGGYFAVHLSLNGIIKSILVHRLVAIAFIRNSKLKRCVNHKNGKKTNNNYWNLAWVTHSQNSKHSFKTKLSKPVYKKVGQYTQEGKLIKRFSSMKEASKITKINQGSICSCAGNKLSNAGGFIWKKN